MPDVTWAGWWSNVSDFATVGGAVAFLGWLVQLSRRALAPPKLVSLRVLIFAAFRRNSRVRFVSTVFLRLEHGGSFVLARNLYRAHSYAPLGGVRKYLGSAKATLDQLGFEVESRPQLDDAERDLRGYVRGRTLPALLRWYLRSSTGDAGLALESNRTCMLRELEEEINNELRLDIPVPGTLHFRGVRTIFEGPLRAPQYEGYSFRVFDIVDIEPGLEPGEAEFLARLKQRAADPGEERLLLVSDQQLRSGRSMNGSTIAPVAEYLRSNSIHRGPFDVVV